MRLMGTEIVLEQGRSYTVEEVKGYLRWLPFRLLNLESPKDEAYKKRSPTRINDITDRLPIDHPDVQILFGYFNDPDSGSVTTERFAPDGKGQYVYIGRKTGG